MSSNLPYKQAANVERRTWDKEVYEARARARNEAAEAAAAGGGASSHQAGRKRPIDAGADATAVSAGATGATGPTAVMDDEAEKEEFLPAASGAAGPERSQRAYLKARKSKVDLERKLGTSEVINPDAVANSGGAATADAGAVSITDGVTKSSTGVGWHCKVCDCYLKDSMTYLDHINGRKHQRYLGYSMRVEKSTKSQVTSKLSDLAEEKRKAEVAAASKDQNPAEDEGNEFEGAVRRKDEEALQRKAERARKREERKKKKQEEQKEEKEELSGSLDPDMAAMMGFSGFGGSNKK